MEIDVVNYKSVDAPAMFVSSLRDTGFAVIDNHSISSELISNVYSEWGRFFNSEEKFRYPYNDEVQDGFVSMDMAETAKGYGIRDIKEYYHLYIPWGRYPTTISDATRELFNSLFSMANVLLKWIEDTVGKEHFAYLQYDLSETPAMSKSLFRVLHYPASSCSDGMWAAPHQDINLLTLLPASTLKGLEVQDANGRWHEVGTNFGQIIINSGDMLQECSNHFFKSTTHRVINKDPNATESRMSFPLFLHPRAEVQLSGKHTAKSYLTERLRENGMLPEDVELKI